MNITTEEEFTAAGSELLACYRVASDLSNAEKRQRVCAKIVELERVIAEAPFEYDEDGNVLRTMDVATEGALDAAPASQMEPDSAATPRTDAEAESWDVSADAGDYVGLDFARTLERDLTAARAEIERLKSQLAHALREQP